MLKEEEMSINDCTGGWLPDHDIGYKPYLVDGEIVWIHDSFFDQTRVIQKPFQRIVKVVGDCMWLELV